MNNDSMYRYEKTRSTKDETSFWEQEALGTSAAAQDNDPPSDKAPTFSMLVLRCCQPLVDLYSPSGGSASTGTNTGWSSSGGNNTNDPNGSDDYDILVDGSSHNPALLVRRQLRKLRILSSILSVVSFIFWVWAIKNTYEMEKGQDLGIYSFLTTLLTSHWVLCKTRKGSISGGVTVLFRVLVTTSHVLVCLNYMLGVLFALYGGEYVYVAFGIYCGIATVGWGGVAFYGFVLLRDLHRGQRLLMTRGQGEDGYGSVQEGDDSSFLAEGGQSYF